jgi:hypothetical protein
MPRYRITIEYDGTPFLGWQVQASGPTVQGTLVEALRAFSGESARITGAGRTDTGVHALGQVAHFDLARDWEPWKLREALNFHLKKHPVVVRDAAVVSSAFDARFSARARHYLYRILARKAPPALDRNRVWWVPRDLDPARSCTIKCARSWAASSWSARVAGGPATWSESCMPGIVRLAGLLRRLAVSTWYRWIIRPRPCQRTPASGTPNRALDSRAAPRLNSTGIQPSNRKEPVMATPQTDDGAIRVYWHPG